MRNKSSETPRHVVLSLRPVAASFLGPDIFLSTSVTNTPSVCSFFNWTVRVSHANQQGTLKQKSTHFRRFLQNYEKRLLASSCLSVRPSVCLSAWKNSAPTGRILIRFRI